MDQWKYFDITHRDHVLCNPMSVGKMEELIGLLRLRAGARVLEVAAGKGEFLVRLAEHSDIEGTGIDLSPYFVAQARAKQASRVPHVRLEFLEMDGADYRAEESEEFDLVACIGASWIYGGYRETLRALASMAAPKAWVLAGEPYWRQEPAAEYLHALAEESASFGTHLGNAEVGRELGLELVYTLVSSQDDWDRYEGLQWNAAATWAAEHPEDPDVDEVMRRVRESRETYLRWGRETLGWAIYVFRSSPGGVRRTL
jgi:SAM-dependent methyltransferase